jgi:four helix bundle protein
MEHGSRPRATSIGERAQNLSLRTKAFALAAIRFYSGMPRESVAQVLGRQLLRSATSVGAQYREAQRAKSIADFVSKTEGALQEIAEAEYWLELINDSGINNGTVLEELRTEADELVAIFVTLTRTAKLNKLRS